MELMIDCFRFRRLDREDFIAFGGGDGDAIPTAKECQSVSDLPPLQFDVRQAF